ncbi:MAG: hypothetical protein N4A71_21855 [Carboxylicivirga sp.]|jgi:hypothetical protein|nr:hypothetical protein [Carboxylicivirga sp.]
MSYYYKKLKAKNERIKELERIIQLKEVQNKQLSSRCATLEDELHFASKDMAKNLDVLKAFVSS